MLFRAAGLLFAAYILAFVRANDDDDLFPTSVPYFIQNVDTGFVFHNPPGSAMGSPIIAAPINGAEPDPQLWTLALVSPGGGDDSGAVYEFAANRTVGVHLSTTGRPGSAVVAQNTSSPFLITPIDDMDGLYTISGPDETEAVTAPTMSGQQLTLQPLNPISPFQQWAVVPFGKVPEDEA
ncbi:hypothetical protein AURDEDRAFT_165330 [Auricularia subglabra TFB-10046 SS5]|nr:hypothetical protein AURDEDRAFT_165330 [Auricularia subglabra TFB-10046 SS5]